jgi:hypothetical protein
MLMNAVGSAFRACCGKHSSVVRVLCATVRPVSLAHCLEYSLGNHDISLLGLMLRPVTAVEIWGVKDVADTLRLRPPKMRHSAPIRSHRRTTSRVCITCRRLCIQGTPRGHLERSRTPSMSSKNCCITTCYGTPHFRCCTWKLPHTPARAPVKCGVSKLLQVIVAQLTARLLLVLREDTLQKASIPCRPASCAQCTSERCGGGRGTANFFGPFDTCPGGM